MVNRERIAKYVLAGAMVALIASGLIGSWTVVPGMTLLVIAMLLTIRHLKQEESAEGPADS